MDTKIENRDHATTPAGLPYAIGGSEELMQRVLIRLTVPRGRFPLDSGLGSTLYKLPRGTKEQMESGARFAIEEALYGLDWVTLESVSAAADPAGESARLDCLFTIGTGRWLRC